MTDYTYVDVPLKGGSHNNTTKTFAVECLEQFSTLVLSSADNTHSEWYNVKHDDDGYRLEYEPGKESPISPTTGTFRRRPDGVLVYESDS